MSEEQMVPLARLNAMIAERDAARAQVETLTVRVGELEAAEPAQVDTGEVEALRSQFAELQQSLQSTQADLASERLANLRTRAANEAGIAPQLAERLQGETFEALVADAQGLAGLIPSAPVGALPAPNGTPVGVTPAQLGDPAWVRENMKTLLTA